MNMNNISSVPVDTFLTVFYDGSCALCTAEMAEISRLDTAGDLCLVDCAATSFDAEPWRAEGVTREDMMAAMHVRDVLGDWHRGVDAFALIYATVGAPLLARLWAHPLTRPVTRRIYPWVARHRHLLQAFGLHLVAPRVLRLFAWRSARRARCEHGACHMPNHPLHEA
jgi:predicted DCC family thiol-disulfide oxidoreductase YuxK